jgi:hypothetical protein
MTGNRLEIGRDPERQGSAAGCRRDAHKCGSGRSQAFAQQVNFVGYTIERLYSSAGALPVIP